MIGGGSDQTPSSSKLLHAQKIEPLTISELISLTHILSHLSLRSLSFFVPPNSLVFRQIKDGVILVARNVHRSFSEIFLLSLASSLINQTLWVSSDQMNETVFVAFDMENSKVNKHSSS